MGSIGAPEILVVLLAALIFLGPKRLPDAARQVGRAMAELRRMSADLQAEVRDALEPDPEPAPYEPPVPLPPPGEHAPGEHAPGDQRPHEQG